VIIVVDFDGTVVHDRDPLALQPGALEALRAMKRAGHTLLLQSARADWSERVNPYVSPLVRRHVEIGLGFDEAYWREHVQPEAERRYQEMLEFVEQELPDVFDAIDDGRSGKLYGDVYLDNRSRRVTCLPLPGVMNWTQVARRYGDPEE